MSDKQAALEAIGRLPDGVSFQEISREIEFLASLREGEEQANQGKVIPLEQVEKNLQTWLSKSS
jgi:predicted transcriptional regulator